MNLWQILKMEEFYGNHELLANFIGDMRIELQKMLKKYNEYRPRTALKDLALVEYISAHSRVASLSQTIRICTVFS